MIDEIEQMCIVNRKTEVLNDKFHQIIDEKSYNCIESLYKLFSDQGEVEFFNKNFLNYVRVRGERIINSQDSKTILN